MGILSKFFNPGEDPLPRFDDPVLGAMEWSKGDEAWIGSYNGFRFALCYERQAAPTPRVLAYAREVLASRDWLLGTLEAEKQVWLPKVPPGVTAEVASLKFGVVQFSFHKDVGYIIADVEGGDGERSWRIEYHDRQCAGLGFDT